MLGRGLLKVLLLPSLSGVCPDMGRRKDTAQELLGDAEEMGRLWAGKMRPYGLWMH